MGEEKTHKQNPPQKVYVIFLLFFIRSQEMPLAGCLNGSEGGPPKVPYVVSKIAFPRFPFSGLCLESRDSITDR